MLAIRSMLGIILIIALFVACNNSTESENQPPSTPQLTQPADGATDQSITPVLSWTCTDPDADSMHYDVLISTQSVPQVLTTYYQENNYVLESLDYNSTYYWKIVAYDNYGNCSVSPVWSFSTINYESGLYSLSNLNVPGLVNDIDINGEYVYLSAYLGGIMTIDVSDKTNPYVLSDFNPPNTIEKIHYSDGYIYAASSSYGIYIIDVSNPEGSNIEGRITVPGYTVDICMSGNYVYTANYEDGISIINCSDKSDPQVVANYDLSNFTNFVSVSGNYLYVANINKVFIFDVSDPANPDSLGLIWLNSDAQEMFVSDDYLFITNADGELVIEDISSPASPAHVCNYEFQQGSLLSAYVSGDFAYLAKDYDGVEVVNISDIANPVHVASYITVDDCGSIVVSGEYVYTGVDENGLQILRFIP